MNVLAHPLPNATDLRLNFKILEGLAAAADLSPEEFQEIWTVVIAIGMAIDTDRPRYSAKIDQAVTAVNRIHTPDGSFIILLSDFDRIFGDQELLEELQERFPKTVTDHSMAICWRFLNWIYNRD